ncbi:MAG: PqqD family protein [Hominenteromicrobium sp.]
MGETLKIKGEMVLREVAGEHILVPLGETALQLTGMISLSESGALLWERLQDGCTEQELVELLLETYDVTPETAQADVAAFLDRVRGLKLL